MQTEVSVRIIVVVLIGVACVACNPWDRDGDGSWAQWRAPLDCDDSDPTRHPTAVEAALNGIDEDCDGLDSVRGSNVVLVTFDALRASNLGAYGYSRDTSPNVDRLAREGVLFQQAFAQAPWTVPSLGSLLTSTYPSVHGAYNSRAGTSAIKPEIPRITEVLRQAGYETAMFFRSAYPLHELGFEKGFETWDKDPFQKIKEIRGWVRERKDRKFFVWVHFFRPHIPYIPSPRFDRFFMPESVSDHRDLARYWNHEECSERYENRTPEQDRIRMGFYDENIRESDSQLGEILVELDESGLANRTLVVFSTDHGDEFFEHGGCDHGLTMYDELIRIPLIIRHLGWIEGGIESLGQVRSIDIAPTILDALELEPPPEFQGESLLPHVLGGSKDLPVFSEFLINNEHAMAIRKDGFKYIRHPSRDLEELYDLERDPKEQTNLADSNPKKLAEMQSQMLQWRAGIQAESPGKPVKFDEETVRRLRALGYLE